MMKKLFNKTTLKIYIVLLCVTFISGCVSAGFVAHYSEKFEETIAAEQENSELDDASQAVLNLITSAVSSLSGSSSSSGNTTATLSDEAKAIQKSKSTSIAVMIILFVVSAVSVAAVITCVQYDKYLLSDKYKAKLKRMKKYEKCYNTGLE